MTPPTHLLLAAILQMVLRNGLATAISRPRPFTVGALNNLRTKLLEDPFFDRDHQPEELGPRFPAPRLAFADVVVLLAGLIRVMMRPQAGLTGTEAEKGERKRLRNEALNLPFFDKERPASANPFAVDPFVDEACADVEA